jgi:hypothetical protein
VDTGIRPWSGEAVAVSSAVTVGLWFVLLANAALAGWLVAVIVGSVPCSGLPCTIVSWGHPGFLIGLSSSCATVLAGCAVVTRGLSRAGAVPLAMAAVGALGGVIALSGVIVLVAAVVIAVAVAGGVLLIVIDRF